ncbi:MAG: hypothetical protein U5K69_22965 [Balneolaceae bacterium]|nr:hypothetical protein [Balneolaceae bacterium]
MLTLVACGDNSTNSEPETRTPPEVPNLQTYQPDTDFFQQTVQKVVQTTNGYQLAQTVVTGTVDPLFMLPNLYLQFYTGAGGTDAEFSNGMWEWTYSYSYGGESVEIRRTVAESANQYTWAVYISYSGTQGPSFDNYKLMEVTTSAEGDVGTWNLYPFETESDETILSMDWDYSDENNQEANYLFSDEEGVEQFDIAYSNQDADFSILIESSDSDPILVNWNEDTNEGLIESEGETLCWDSTLNDVACS